MEKVTSAFVILTEWVTNLFLLHLYWIGGTLIGGIILGIIPSTIALFSAIRQLLMNGNNDDIFHYFKNEYWLHFKHSRFIDIIYAFSLFCLYSFSAFTRSTRGSWLAYTHIFIYLFFGLLILFLLYLIPVYIHYEMDIKKVPQNTFIILFVNMKWNIPMILSVVAVILMHIKFSVTILFFGASFTPFVILIYCLKIFEEFDLKQNEINKI